MSDNTYTCCCCEEVCEKGWSDEDAMAESKILFGDMPYDAMAVICDDCFRKIYGGNA